MMMKAAAVLAACFLARAVNGVELTMDNFEEMTVGKVVFMKFYDPMCGHCIQMEDAWEQLEASFEHSKTKLIAEIDCTEEKELCADFGVSSFPTLKWGDLYHLQDYEGPREYESLKKFSDKHLKPGCGPDHVQLCDKATRREIRRLKQLTLAELDKEMAVETERVNAVDAAQQDFVEGLEAQYKAESDLKDVVKKSIMDSGLTLMKLVAEERGIPIKKKKEEDEE